MGNVPPPPPTWQDWRYGDICRDEMSLLMLLARRGGMMLYSDLRHMWNRWDAHGHALETKGYLDFEASFYWDRAELTDLGWLAVTSYTEESTK